MSVALRSKVSFLVCFKVCPLKLVTALCSVATLQHGVAAYSFIAIFIALSFAQV